jgi:hypothetical protein
MCDSSEVGPRWEKTDLGVIVGSTDPIEVLAMKFCGGNNLETDEQSGDSELLDNLIEQGTFAFVLKVMNGEPATTTSKDPSGVNGSCAFHSRMLTLSSPQSIFSTAEPGGRRIHGYHTLHTLTMLEYEGGQPAVASTQVEH